MTLDDWLGQIQSVHPKSWDLGLERVGAVGAKMDLLKPARQVFLVAGTNGKGSTCEYLSAYCVALGLSYGKTTSPFLTRYNEQIVIDGVPAGDSEIIEAFEAIEAARGEISLSYFEFGTLAAFYVFQKRQVEVAIVEIGLGGRLDAMNIVDPDVSVITKIALDHQDWLGDTREVIAIEKAGIMRNAKPVVIVDDDPPTTLQSEADRIGARPVMPNLSGTLLKVGEKQYEIPHMRLPGPSGIAATLAMHEAGYELKQQTVTEVLSTTSLPGRYQQLDHTPAVILDVAHNPNAALYLRARLEAEGIADLHAVVGMFKDKDHASVFQHLSPLVSSWHFVDLPGERGAEAKDLCAVLSDSCGLTGQTYDKVSNAIEAAILSSDPQGTVLVMGSFITVAAALEHLVEHPQLTSN